MIGTEQIPSNGLHVRLDVFVPQLAYTYHLLRAVYSPSLYPVFVRADLEGKPNFQVCHDEDQLREGLRKVFADEQILKSLRALIAQAQEEEKVKKFFL